MSTTYIQANHTVMVKRFVTSLNSHFTIERGGGSFFQNISSTFLFLETVLYPQDAMD